MTNYTVISKKETQTIYFPLPLCYNIHVVISYVLGQQYTVISGVFGEMSELVSWAELMKLPRAAAQNTINDTENNSAQCIWGADIMDI